MKTSELKEKLGDNFNDFFRGTTDCYTVGSKHELHGVEFEVVRHERDNAYMEHVIKIGDAHYRLLGSYDSWNGTSWDYCDVVEVKPVEVVVIQYQSV